jgi:hypothetical protein
MTPQDVARVVLLMASLPATVNLLESIMLPVSMPFLGRGWRKPPGEERLRPYRATTLSASVSEIDVPTTNDILFDRWLCFLPRPRSANGPATAWIHPRISHKG